MQVNTTNTHTQAIRIGFLLLASLCFLYQEHEAKQNICHVVPAISLGNVKGSLEPQQNKKKVLLTVQLKDLLSRVIAGTCLEVIFTDISPNMLK